FEPPWPALDRLMLTVLVVGQLGLAVVGAGLPGVFHELAPAGFATDLAGWPGEWYRHTFDTGAWLLLGVLAGALTLTLWTGRPRGAVLGFVILAVTIPVLAAGPFDR